MLKKLMFVLNGRSLHRRHVAGFTLIELSISLIIMGIMVSTFCLYLNGQAKAKAIKTTKDNLARSELALRSFLEMNGSYPCPASFNARRGNDAFGRAPVQCLTDPSHIPVNLKNHDEYMIAVGRGNRIVRTGLLPFRSLGISDSQAVDGWGNILQYAITEILTDPGQFDQRGGAIDVTAEDGKSRLKPEKSAQYVVFSSGEDGKGGYSYDGTPLGTCPEKTLEAENCNGDAVFMDSPLRFETRKNDNRRSYSTTVDFDDYLTYQQFDPAPNAKGGLLFFYYGSCMAGFAEVPVGEHDVMGVETLGKMPSFNSKEDISKDEKLCFSSRFSVSMVLLNSAQSGEAKGCPPGWTEIGYKLYQPTDGISQFHMTRGGAGSINNLVCAR